MESERALSNRQPETRRQRRKRQRLAEAASLLEPSADEPSADEPPADDQRLPARTTFRRLAQLTAHCGPGAADERIVSCALLVAQLHSGRRHQIRRHLHHLAHQVIGDTKYGKGLINQALRDYFGLPRMCLHAWKVSFTHPHTQQTIALQAALPEDLRAFLERLGAEPDLLAGL
jgi:23S rRNA-/tRNA-specific pseudouridylate synthase